MQASETEVHDAVLDGRLSGTSPVPLQAQRLLSLHIRLITLRCRYSDVFYHWSEQILALGRVIQERGQVATSAGMHAALTDAGLHVRPLVVVQAPICCSAYACADGW